MFLIHIFQRFRMSVHDFQIKAPPGRMDGSRLYQKVTAEISITSGTQPSLSYPQLWPRDHGRKNEIVDVNGGNEVFFDASLGAISWRPPPERCNYTSGWRCLQLLWLACSVPSILPAHFQLFSTAVFEFILESITIVPSVWGFNEMHLIRDERERTKTWENVRDVTWVVYCRLCKDSLLESKSHRHEPLELVGVSDCDVSWSRSRGAIPGERPQTQWRD